MSATKFICPNCRAILRTSQPIETGKTIKCPKCATPFIVKAEATPSPAPAPIMAVADEDDDAPARPHHLRRKFRRKARNAPDNTIVMIGVVALLCVLVAGVGIGIAVYFWPSSDDGDADRQRQLSMMKDFRADPPFRPPNWPPPGQDFGGPPGGQFPGGTFDPRQLNIGSLNFGNLPVRTPAQLDGLNYLPSKSNTVFAVDVANLTSHQPLVALVQQLMSQATPRNDRNLEQLLPVPWQDIDHLVVATTDDFSEFPPTGVIKTKRPFDRNKIIEHYNAGPPKTLHGKQYYTPPEGENTPAFLYMPNNQILVWSELPEMQFELILNLDGKKPALAPQTLAYMQRMQPGHVWMIGPFEAMKDAAQNFLPTDPIDEARMPAEMKKALETLSKAETFGWSLRLQDEYLRLVQGAACKDSATAAQVAAAVQHLWNTEGKRSLENAKVFMPADVQSIFDNLVNSLQFQTQGDIAQASLSISVKTIDALIQAVMREITNQGGGGFRRPR